MPCIDKSMIGDPYIFAIRLDRHLRTERQRLERRHFHIGRGIDEGAQRRDAVRWPARCRPEQMRGKIADIGISVELAPGPALVLLIDRDALAAERLRVEGGIGRGPAPDVRNRTDDLHLATFDENRGLDMTLQMRRREIGARRREAAVEGHRHRALFYPGGAACQGAALST